MNLSKTAIAICVAVAPLAAGAKGVTVHGSVQSDILFPEKDYKIGTEDYKDKVLTNTYADVGLYSQFVDAGLRVEYLEHPLPGFEPDFKGWGVPNIYVKGKYKGFELTAGDFYEQFGSGFILRTYEERSLGIDNSIRGGRLKVNALKGFRFTALGGIQRRFWDWSKESRVFGADVEFDLNDYVKSFSNKGIIWTFGASYVLKNEEKEDIIVPGTNFKLNLPKNVNAFDVRTHFYRGGLSLLGEFAWKGQDPSFDNNYTYRHGNALMLSAAYSKTGWSALLQVKRSEDMSFRSQRSMSLTSAFLNNMPAFAYQHTYSLAALYPYATQAAPGEWAFQGAFAYTFKRKTALGGKYGTKLKLNVSYIRGLHHTGGEKFHNSLYGTDGGHTSFFKMGELNYQDINLQLDKKITKEFHLNFMYMNQRYNQTVVEGHGGMINSNILVLEPKWKMSNKLTLRGEFQYLFTKQDKGDWAYGLLELSILPYLMVSVSDQWNCGETNLHYYMATVTGNYRRNRLMVGYGRTRAGYNCSGGVCRYVPASRGFQLAYSYNF
jgi:hypothetical protein